MQAHTLTYYNWHYDVQNELCRLMHIDPSMFRRYHEVVGGERKDFWHAWMHVCVDGYVNDSYIVLCFDDAIDALNQLSDSHQYAWAVEPLSAALKSLKDEVKTDEITIFYSW